LRLAGKAGGERLSSLWKTSKRWLTTTLNVLTLAALIVAALVIGGLVIGTTTLIRTHIETNPLALVVEVHGGIGARVKTITEADEADIRSFAVVGDCVQPAPSAPKDERVVHYVAGWNDYDLWFWTKDGAQDADFAPGRTVQRGDPILQKLRYRSKVGTSVLLPDGAPEIIVTQGLLGQLKYSSPPESLRVTYKGLAAPLKVRAVAEWIPSSEFLINETFYRQFRDKQWKWPPRHDHAHLGPLSDEQGQEILVLCRDYLDGQRVQGRVVERAGRDRWLRLSLDQGESWTQEYWQGTLIGTVGLFMKSKEWYKELRAEFDEPLPSEEEEWSTLDIGFTRASVYVKELEAVPGVVEALKERGLGVDDRIAQEVVFLQQVSSFGNRLFAWVIGTVGLMAVVNIGLSFAQTIQRKRAQIGILRACGASRPFIFLIYIFEATILWTFASIIGVLVASPAGNWIGDHLMQAWQQKGAGSLDLSQQIGCRFFHVPWALALLTLGGSLLVCWLATAWAALNAARVNPAVAVRSRE